MTKKYSEDDIAALSDRDHVRLRLPVYAGSTSEREYDIPFMGDGRFTTKTVAFIPAVYKAIGEILDNSIDEFAQLPNQKTKLLKIDAQPILGTYTISDNGRGVPIGKHNKTGKPTPELVFGSLRSGRNFGDNKEAGVLGMNGMGSAMTNYCSAQFSVDIRRDGKRYRQQFSDGALTISKPSITKIQSQTTGTTINFQLDPAVFDDITLPDELMQNRAIEIALTNPGITTEYNRKKYKFNNGFDDIVKKFSKDYFKFESEGLEFFVIFDAHQGIDEQVCTWVNSSYLFDGGLCNAQFSNAFYDNVIKSLTTVAKREKIVVTKNDVRRNLLIIGNVKVSDPEYDSQSKTRMTGPNLRKEMGQIVTDNWKTFAKKNKTWLMETVLAHARFRHHGDENKKAAKDHDKRLSGKIPGLKDANSKNRWMCKLLVTEGDSAASMISEVRDPETIAILPLRGKINNVHGMTVAQVLKMEKVAGLLAAIGLKPGKKAVRGDLKYGQVVITTDADVDGGDIFALLCNLFYTFWPELFDSEYEPFVYRLIAPNVCLTKKDKRVHFATASEYGEKKSKYAGWAVDYYKGLGSMETEDWDMILEGGTDSMIPIVEDGNIKEMLDLLFGPSSDDRKAWLQE